MRIEVIDTLERLVALRPSWDAVHASDPAADFFLSFTWMERTLDAHPGQWRIVVAYDRDGHARAFLPLRHRTRWSGKSGQFRTDIEPAGKLSWAQYVGVLCAPDQEERAFPALATAVQALPWAKWHHRYDPSPERWDRFLAHFPADRFRVRREPYRINDNTVDALTCPYLELPDSYDGWLAERLSRNTRQRVRRFIRRFEEDDAFRIVRGDAADFAWRLDALLSLWHATWGPTRRPGRAREAVRRFRRVFEQSHAIGAVEIPVMLRDGRPVAALGCLVDRAGKRLFFIAAGRDPDEEGNAGLVLHAHNIAWAIEHGIRAYDLCHGNEYYKYSLGATDRVTTNVTVERRSADRSPRYDAADGAGAARAVERLIERGEHAVAAKAAERLASMLRG